MYEATGEEVCKEAVMTYLSGLEAPEGLAEGLPIQDSLACFFCFGSDRE